MEAAISVLRSCGQEEFLRSTRTAAMIVQNVLSDPREAKYRRIRAASKVNPQAATAGGAHQISTGVDAVRQRVYQYMYCRHHMYWRANRIEPV